MRRRTRTARSSDRSRLVAAATTLLLATALTGCSSDGDTASTSTAKKAAATPTSTTTTIVRPDGPIADLSEQITGVGRPFIGEAATVGIDTSGYVEEEFVAAGTAGSYAAEGELTEDGRWSFTAGPTAAYRTRVLVRRPAEASDFSGTVVVEWLNVSGGIDANPGYASAAEEIMRQGHAWVGISAQLVGVAGGPVLVPAPGAETLAGRGLVGIAPDRYASLSHPGDGYSFDIVTQVARALRTGAGLGGMTPDRLIADGESQSAIALTTYYNGVQPLTLAFDGFLIHSRASAALPLVGPGEYADLRNAIGRATALLRDDVAAPALEIQAESDVVGVLDSISARQDDSDTFRLWEVAGTAHADRHLLGPVADAIDCGAPINNGPMHVVVKAALHQLEAWVRTGEAPPIAPRLDTVAGATPVQLARDADGIATGGIRTPPVDVPVDALTGESGSSPALICILLGTTRPLAATRLAELYPSVSDYQDRYAAAADEAIDAGFALEDDRDALMAFADPDRLAG